MTDFLETIGMATSAIGSFTQAGAARQQGENQQDALNYQASVLRLQAEQETERGIEEEAYATRKANELWRQGLLEESRSLAVGAAAGGGTRGDVLKTIADFRGVTTENALNTLTEGRSRASQYYKSAGYKRLDADNTEYLGRVAKSTGKAAGNAALISGIGTFIGDYGDYRDKKSTTTTTTPKKKSYSNSSNDPMDYYVYDRKQLRDLKKSGWRHK